MRDSAPRGFTVVEALVATAMFGVAGATLVASLTVVRAARARALAALAVADAAANHAAMLARRPCAAPDTAGRVSARGVAGHWSATRRPEGWFLVDSVAMPGAGAATALSGYVTCR